MSKVFQQIIEDVAQPSPAVVSYSTGKFMPRVKPMSPLRGWFVSTLKFDPGPLGEQYCL
jgi:hypothetical protein